MMVRARAEVVRQKAAPGRWRAADLEMALRVLDEGSYYDSGLGETRLPTVLTTLLTETCATCGQTSTLEWSGPIPDIEDQIAKQSAVVAQLDGQLNSNVAAAEALLAEGETEAALTATATS
jgi:hypothetical protein